MAQQLPPILNSTPENILEQLKKNVTLIKFGNRKLILKGKRDKEKNILERLRFRNEKGIYKTFSESNFKNLNIPQHVLNGQTDNLILEYISSNKEQSVPSEVFIKSYLELQRLKPKYDLYLDSYNKFFRGFFYRVFLVSLQTISRKINLKIALKSVSLYITLNLRQKTLSREF